MAAFLTQSPWIFIFGLLGNFVSFVVFLSPIPTFLRVCKKKSTEGFQSFPYVMTLLSAMLWLYYALLKSDALLLITINSVGCLIETVYIALYIAYAPKQTRIVTLKMLILLNFGGFCLVLLFSHLVVKGSNRIKVLGWICVAFSVSVFVAPLSIMVPNIAGFIFGLLQMLLYVIYKNNKTALPMEPELPQHNIRIAVLSTISCERQQTVSPEPNEQDDHPENSKNPSSQERHVNFEVRFQNLAST